MKATFLFALAWILSEQNCFSQKITIFIDGVEGDRPLTFKDYKGKPDKQNSHDAETAASVMCDYSHLQVKGDSITVENPVVRVELVSGKSWKKRENDTLLKHEQGHFDVKKMWGTALKRAFDSIIVPRSGYLYYLNALANSINKKYLAMDVQYDKETDHGRNMVAQEKWNQFFKDNLPG